MSNFLKNYLSTLTFIFIVFIYYTQNSYFSSFFSGNYFFLFDSFNIFGWHIDVSRFELDIYSVFIGLIISYIVLLIPYYVIYKDKSKARLVLEYIVNKFIFKKKFTINQETKVAMLALLVKGFFVPLMIFWLTGHIFELINGLHSAYLNFYLTRENFLMFFNNYFFWTAFSLILFFDVGFFTIGYLIEGKMFNNVIKSVEPTLLGWMVTLMAYPPFNGVTDKYLGWYSTDFPYFSNFYLHIFLNISILILMGIYSWASISLGFKASNLTNRGIVSKGPYRYFRHPAYVCKNLAWWIGGLPIIFKSITTLDYKLFIIAILSLSFWSFVYYMRAITEERHLSMDSDYIEYKKKVKNKFIPSLRN